MKVAVIENRLKDYVIDIFNRHQDAQIDLISFLDWKPQQDQYQEISIGRIEELDNGQYDIVLIAIKENRYLSRLLTYLHKKHIQNVYIVRLFALDMREDFLDETQPMYLDRVKVDSVPKENEKPYLVHLETHVCDHCNLNCKACNNFSPFVKEPSYADIDQFERDLKRLTELFTGIGRFFLLGGEPLLAPALCCEMIRCYRKYFPTNELRVLTNATLILSMKDEFWDCVRENDVIIHISLYPPVKERIDEIRERLESEKVRYIVFKEVETFAKHWTAYPFEDEKFNNERCGSAGCHYLRNGEISKCPDAMLVDFMVDGNAGLKSLGLNDRENLVQVNNAWELIEKIDNPIDLCNKCTYKRLKPIKWERIDGEAQSSDWLLPHWYEFEIENLKCANDKAKDEIRKLKGTVETLNNEKEILNSEKEALSSENELLKKRVENQNKEIEILQDENKNKDCELKLKEEEISEYNLRVKELNKEVNVWRTKYNNTNSQLRYAQQEYQRINVSYSHRIGRCITWLPRKVRGVIQTWERKFRETGLYKLYHLFNKEILKGYHNYAELCLNHSDRQLFLQFYQGTGDVYLSAIYLKYCEKNEMVGKSVLLVSSQNAIKVASLLNFEDCMLVLIDKENAMSLVQLMRFIGLEKIRISNLHYMSDNPLYTNFIIHLLGINGMNFMDFYREIVYRGAIFPFPELAWKNNNLWLDNMVKDHLLVKSKTVLIAPGAYSSGMKLSKHFWDELSRSLKIQGYTVCTNITSEKETVISGSKGVFIPYEYLQCFLEYCGYFIGYRSGLCDLVAKVNCKKIIIYPNIIWPWSWGISSFLNIFSLKKMEMSDDAIEVEYVKEREKEIIDNIVQQCNEI